jgi:hypothetical protein
LKLIVFTLSYCDASSFFLSSRLITLSFAISITISFVENGKVKVNTNISTKLFINASNSFLTVLQHIKNVNVKGAIVHFNFSGIETLSLHVVVCANANFLEELSKDILVSFNKAHHCIITTCRGKRSNTKLLNKILC